MSSLCRSVGIPGTAAVVAAYYLHLDPYGHFHWSSADALVGLACVAPLAALGQSLHVCPCASVVLVPGQMCCTALVQQRSMHVSKLA